MQCNFVRRALRLRAQYEIGLAESKLAYKNCGQKKFDKQKTALSDIPALKDAFDWILDTAGKANCFASCFEATQIMIEQVANEYSEIQNAHPVFYCGLPTIEAPETA